VHTKFKQELENRKTWQTPIIINLCEQNLKMAVRQTKKWQRQYLLTFLAVK
jgi:hypothetical protein